MLGEIVGLVGIYIPTDEIVWVIAGCAEMDVFWMDGSGLVHVGYC